MSSLLVFIAFASFAAVHSEMCGPCICQESVAVCYVRSCTSLLVKSPDVEILRIFGTVCETHIVALQDDIYYNTIVELMDSSCEERINNCRYSIYKYNFSAFVFHLKILSHITEIIFVTQRQLKTEGNNYSCLDFY